MGIFSSKKVRKVFSKVVLFHSDDSIDIHCVNYYSKEKVTLSSNDFPMIATYTNEILARSKNREKIMLEVSFSKNEDKIKGIKLLIGKGDIPKVAMKPRQETLTRGYIRAINKKPDTKKRLQETSDTWIFKEDSERHSIPINQLKIKKARILRLLRSNGLVVTFDIGDKKKAKIILTEDQLRGAVHRNLKKVMKRNIEFDVEIWDEVILAFNLTNSDKYLADNAKTGDFSNPFK